MGTQNSKIAKVINDSVSYYKTPLLLQKPPLYCTGGMQPYSKYKHKANEPIHLKTEAVAHNAHHKTEFILPENLCRRRIEKTSEWPWCAHGIILTNVKGTVYWSSGTMITANVVLTAAQNLYSREHGAYAEIIGFFPAVHDNILPFGEAKVEDYFVPQEYIDSGAENYALLMLQSPIGEFTGYLPLSIADSIDLSQTFTVTGYPSDKVKGEPPMYEMWQIEAKPSEVLSSPGSAVHQASDRSYITLGVYTQGNEGDNGVTLITRSRYDRMYNWIKDTTDRKVKLNQNDYAEMIDLYNSGINSSGLKSFVTIPLRNLTQLLAVNCGYGSAEARILSTNTIWTNLEEISLSQNQIGVVGAEFLANNTTWVNLRKLILIRNQLGSAEAQALAKNTSWVNLEQLLLGDNQIGDAGVEALAKNTSWINLKEIGLNKNQLGDASIEHLVHNNSWPNLRKIDLGNNDIGLIGIETLAKSNLWPKLRKLALWFNKLGDAGVGALAKNTTWVKLKYLDLNKTEIGPAGAGLLAKNASWVHLEKLYLGNNHIGDTGVGELSKNSSWINLRWLDLCSVNITEVGARALAQNSSWNQLSMLILDNNDIEEEGKEVLKGNINWPKVHIAYDYYMD